MVSPEEKVPRAFPSSQVSLKTAATVCLTVLAFIALVWLLVRAHLALTLVLLSALVAVALHHAVEWLMRRGLRKSIAMPAVIGTTVLVLAGLIALVVPPAVGQGKALVREAPALLEQVRESRAYR